MLKSPAITFLGGLICGALLIYIIPPNSTDATAPEENLSLNPPSSADIAIESDQKVPDTCQLDLIECQQTIVEVRDAHEDAIKRYSENEELVEYLSDIVARTSPDLPMEFPEQLDDQFKPERFEEAVARLKEECPQVFTQDSRADCSEYPCIIEFPSQEKLQPGQQFPLPELCPKLQEYLPSTLGQQFVSQEGDETWIQYMPYGSGVGLNDHLRDQQLRLMERGRKRWTEKRQEVAIRAYEEACLNEQDRDACFHLINAFDNMPDQREVYAQIGCDAQDPRACYSYAHNRCISRGNCDASAEHFARRAIDMDDTKSSYHMTLGIILCKRNQHTLAKTHFQLACNLGDTNACSRNCTL